MGCITFNTIMLKILFFTLTLTLGLTREAGTAGRSSAFRVMLCHLSVRGWVSHELSATTDFAAHGSYDTTSPLTGWHGFTALGDGFAICYRFAYTHRFYNPSLPPTLALQEGTVDSRQAGVVRSGQHRRLPPAIPCDQRTHGIFIQLII